MTIRAEGNSMKGDSRRNDLTFYLHAVLNFI